MELASQELKKLFIFFRNRNCYNWGGNFQSPKYKNSLYFWKNTCEVSKAAREKGNAAAMKNSYKISAAAKANSYEANTVTEFSKKLRKSWTLRVK